MVLTQADSLRFAAFRFCKKPIFIPSKETPENRSDCVEECAFVSVKKHEWTKATLSKAPPKHSQTIDFGLQTGVNVSSCLIL